ncbi:uncharacterized protein B0J16DRAFT_393987 [Fusarium flagelliforme]|uniref:Uncharacterized protein n=1 Tax=Fusarium flagelliforme TaxID=2675880 RepID=A0A395N642_9HYPO|nr:uncharacterized protein B0J16DRAFT_393987 [Fusarium flagelliforme]KAH7191904.1 hypothetical protein B0J16DRAFT_393987 [Fusarium flagelliforme]RFN55119.1 hypothetical protein FIE12Z_631 [Fusarium flagelliforme]
MPKGSTSYNRERFRSQPYGWRSVQSNQQSVFSASFSNTSEVQTSTGQPVDQAVPEVPNNDTGEHTDESAHLGGYPVTAPVHQGNLPHADVEPAEPPADEPWVIDVDGSNPRADTNSGPGEPPRGPRSSRTRYDSYRPRELKMVNSMLLQSISRTNSRAPPSISIYNNSRGGGVQDNVFTKVPSTSKTISFRVDSEETLLQAYRHVKAMNPSAPVGGIMFSVPPKTEKHEFLFTEVNNIRWNALTGRQNPQLPPGWKFFRNKDGGFTVNTGMPMH